MGILLSITILFAVINMLLLLVTYELGREEHKCTKWVSMLCVMTFTATVTLILSWGIV